ncbi:MAG: hypothetical protein AAF547_08595 [Actinomycetota bacterium]
MGNYFPADRLVATDRWADWWDSPQGRVRRHRWAIIEPALVTWSTETADRVTSPRWSPATDAAQGALIALAQSGDGEAAVTLLVQLRPGLGRLVRTVAGAEGLAGWDAIEEVRATFLETVARHRLDRRPSRIAANLLLDTRQRLARARRPPVGTAQPAQPWARPATAMTAAGPHARSVRLAADRLLNAAMGLGGTPESARATAEVAYRCWLLDQPRTVVADATGLSAQGVTGRLHRLRRTLRLDAPDGAWPQAPHPVPAGSSSPG